MVKPILDYAATAWSPHTQKDINTIERSQRQAARFVLNKFSTYASVLQMLTIANLDWLTCRAQQKAIMMFKIVNHLIDIPASSYLSPAPTAHNIYVQEEIHTTNDKG